MNQKMWIDHQESGNHVSILRKYHLKNSNSEGLSWIYCNQIAFFLTQVFLLIEIGCASM